MHYTAAEPQERVPSNVIPVDMRMQNTIQTRAFLHSQGQIVQKEFMLHDRQNWPSIAFPRNPQRGPMYAGNIPPARIPQAMAYPPQHPTAGPPAKRVRTQPSASQAGATSAVAVLDADDEEDTSRGDLFDHTTPREVSMARYKQNHEWMEEILSSPYAINQIIPADLGLGVRGELSSLTEGIFDAPTDPDKDVAKHSYVGRLDPEKAEEFRKRTAAHIAQTTKDIEKMKAKHAKRLAKLQKGSLLRFAETELRLAVHDPTDTGPEFWRFEGRVDDEDAENPTAVKNSSTKVSDIVAKVEASVGRHAAAVKELIRIQDGGYEEAPAIPSPPPAPIPIAHVSPPISHNGSTHSGVLVENPDIDMSNSAAGLLDQYHTGLSAHATPSGSTNNFPTPQAHLQTHSSAGTPNVMHAPSPQPIPQMHHSSQQPDHGHAASEAAANDWVVVPPGGVSPLHHPAHEAAHHPLTTTTTAAPLPQQSQHHTTSSHSTPAATAAAHPSPLAAAAAANQHGNSAVQTPSELPPAAFHHTTATTTTAGTSPDAFADLGDLDTAGDALASYADHGGEGGLGELSLDMDGDVGMGGGGGGGGGAGGMEGALDGVGGVDGGGLEGEMGGEMGGEMMDDSAFGEAFHAHVDGGAGGVGEGEGAGGEGM